MHRLFNFYIFIPNYHYILLCKMHIQLIFVRIIVITRPYSVEAASKSSRQPSPWFPYLNNWLARRRPVKEVQVVPAVSRYPARNFTHRDLRQQVFERERCSGSGWERTHRRSFNLSRSARVIMTRVILHCSRRVVSLCSVRKDLVIFLETAHLC